MNQMVKSSLVPLALMYAKMSSKAKQIMIYLSYNNELCNSPKALTVLADKLGVKYETCRRHVKWLVDNGYLERRRYSHRFGYIYSIPDKYKVK